MVDSVGAYIYIYTIFWKHIDLTDGLAWQLPCLLLLYSASHPRIDEEGVADLLLDESLGSASY